jgi:7-keto-8-aminopelargonate synthetase-like enzyme
MGNIAHVRRALRSLGIEAHEHDSAIFAFTLGDVPRMERIESMLEERGVLLTLMDYPNGPAPKYFRLAINASHTHEQIDRFAQVLGDVLEQIEKRETISS